MNFLLLYIGENEKFDIVRAKEALETMPGAHPIEGEIAQLNYEYSFEDDSTLLRLASDYQSVSIDGSGPASLKCAVEFGQRYGGSLRITDADFAFDADLNDVQSATELDQLIRETAAEG